MRDEFQLPLGAPQMREGNQQIIIRLSSGQIIKPLYKTHALAVQIASQIEPFLLLLCADPIKIDVINRQSAVVLVDQSEGRASNPSLLGNSYALGETPYEAGFARPQFADKPNDFTTLNQLSKSFTPTHRLARRFRTSSPQAHIVGASRPNDAGSGAEY